MGNAGGFVAPLLPTARARLRSFGLRPRLKTTVLVYDDVAAFAQATGQTVPSLRAWSSWSTIHLLPPSTWSDPTSAPARLTHELCHLALWQRADDEEQARRLPRFVAEGVCSVVADQGDSRMARTDVVARADVSRDDDFGVDFEGDAGFSYGFAHHVFASFVRCRGEGALIAVVDACLAGERVEQALGASPRSLLDDICPPP